MREKIGEDYPRNSVGVKCSCGGYAEATGEEPTGDEVKAYDCVRPYACCTAVFRCVVCGKEMIAGFESPDMDFC